MFTSRGVFEAEMRGIYERAWVHVAEATSFLAAYMRHVRPDMPGGEQDEYYRQFAIIARALGAHPVPTLAPTSVTAFTTVTTHFIPMMVWRGQSQTEASVLLAVFAWLETWEKVDGAWHVTAVASTDRPGEPEAYFPGEALLRRARGR